MKIRSILMICAILLTVVYVSVDYIDIGGENMDKETREYQGPVPEGYNEEHYRETGETIKSEEVRA